MGQNISNVIGQEGLFLLTEGTDVEGFVRFFVELVQLETSMDNPIRYSVIVSKTFGKGGDVEAMRRRGNTNYLK